jgi:DNA-binding CsgD family transcriptional regulator
MPVASERFDSLTPRQRDVVPLMAEGLQNKEIAKRLGMAEGTVRVHVHAVIRALGCRNRTEVAVAVSGQPAQEVPSSAHLVAIVRSAAPDVMRIVAAEESGALKPDEARKLIEDIVALAAA